MLIPKSQWVVLPTYFEAVLVDGFESKYKDWLISIGTDEEHIKESNLDYTIWIWLNTSHSVWLYQFPNDIHPNQGEEDADYFEKEDDNWVISRHLFEPVEIVDTGWQPSKEFWEAACDAADNVYGRNNDSGK